MTPLHAKLAQLDAPAPDLSVGRVLRVPLIVKVLGANVLIGISAWLAVYVSHRTYPGNESMLIVLASALLAGTAVSWVLVSIALRPIHSLEQTVLQVQRGDERARVPRSSVGDRELDKVGGTVNALLDHLAQDRERMQALASEVIRAEDRERARIGRELHESIAQSLAALTYQLMAAEKDSHDPILAARVRAIRAMASQILDEVDMLSHSVHPRVLNDLGLLPALRHLARTVADARHAVEVRLVAGHEADVRALDTESAAALYRVAQEAIQNAMRHGAARRIDIGLGAAGDAITLTVADDGTGFSLTDAARAQPGTGLFTMRERIGLVHGEFSVETAPGRGTSVCVKIPVGHDTFQPVEAAS